MDLHAERLGRGDSRLVLVHGFTQTGRSWSALATELARHREVVVIDAPGHAGSSAARAGLVDGARLLGDAGGPAVYVGYSMGGRFCLHLALARPDLVLGLVLLGATAGIMDDQERAARRATDDVLATELERDGVPSFLDRWLAQPLFLGLPADPADRADRERNDIAGLAASLRLAGTGSQEPLWGRLGELTMPVLVLAGERDDTFAALGRRMAASIGPNATFTTVLGAGHAAHREQPERFLSALEGWLSSRFT